MSFVKNAWCSSYAFVELYSQQLALYLQNWIAGHTEFVEDLSTLLLRFTTKYFEATAVVLALELHLPIFSVNFIGSD